MITRPIVKGMFNLQNSGESALHAIIMDDSFSMSGNKENVQNKTIVNRWKSNILLEYTPRGNVIMYYDVDKQSFSSSLESDKYISIVYVLPIFL